MANLTKLLLLIINILCCVSVSPSETYAKLINPQIPSLTLSTRNDPRGHGLYNCSPTSRPFILNSRSHITPYREHTCVRNLKCCKYHHHHHSLMIEDLSPCGISRGFWCLALYILWRPGLSVQKPPPFALVLCSRGLSHWSCASR